MRFLDAMDFMDRGVQAAESGRTIPITGLGLPIPIDNCPHASNQRRVRAPSVWASVTGFINPRASTLE